MPNAYCQLPGDFCTCEGMFLSDLWFKIHITIQVTKDKIRGFWLKTDQELRVVFKKQTI